MTRTFRALVNAAAFAATALFAYPASACIPAPFLPRSNFELVKDASDIVLAQAMKPEAGQPRHFIRFHILRSLKGICPEKALLRALEMPPTPIR